MWKDYSEVLEKECLERAQELYGIELPEIVHKRIEEELSLIDYRKSSEIFIILSRVFRTIGLKPCDYYISDRIGASFVAYLLGINGDINPLKPHYRCDSCKNSIFDVSKKVKIGLDLPPKVCPKCGKNYIRDGYDIKSCWFYGGAEEWWFSVNYYMPNHMKTNFFAALKEMTDIRGVINGNASLTRRNSKNINLNDSIELLDNSSCSAIEEGEKEKIGALLREYLDKGHNVRNGTILLFPNRISNSNEFVRIIFSDFNELCDGLVLLYEWLAKESIGNHDCITDFTLQRNFVISDALNKKWDMPVIHMLFDRYLTGKEIMVYYEVENFYDFLRVVGLGLFPWEYNGGDLLIKGVVGKDELLCFRDDIMDYLLDLGFNEEKSYKYADDIVLSKGFSEEQEEELRLQGAEEWFIEDCNDNRFRFSKSACVSIAKLMWKLLYYGCYVDEGALYQAFKKKDFILEA